MVGLTSSVNEKYGNQQSFYLKLRSQENDDESQVIRYKNPVSSKWQDPDFGAIIMDNRNAKVEVIREIPDLKEAYSPHDGYNSRNNTMSQSFSLRKTKVRQP